MSPRASSYFFFILLLGAAAATALIFLPFLTPVMLAIATAIITYPVYRRLARLLGGGVWAGRIAAAATVVGVLAVVLIPLFLLAGTVYSEIQYLYGALTDEGSRSQVIAALNSLSKAFSDLAFGVLQPYSFDALNVTDYLKSALEWLFAHVDSIFTGLALVAGYVVIFLLGLFYFLRDGEALTRRFLFWSPHLEHNREFIVGTVKRAIQSVFVGALSVGLLEGLATGVGFTVFGIPAPALWGTVAAVAALIPGFGVSIVILPGAAYLLLGGNYVYAAGLLVWGFTGIFVIDHLVGPALVNRGIRIHPFLVLLSVLGGIMLFGVIGFVMGPVVLAILFALLDIYRISARQVANDQ